jgi:hypothetical protein
MKFNPQLIVYHKRRENLKDVFTQIYRNGKAKIELLKLHKDTISVIDIIPPLYFIAILFSLYSSILGNTFFLRSLLFGTLGYFLVKPFIILMKTGEMKYYPHLFVIIFIREMAYFLGILSGLTRIFKRSGG